VSRAFIRETDGTFERLPDRPVSARQNLVTPEGLVQIEAILARLRKSLRSNLFADLLRRALPRLLISSARCL
jgi:hypothetical protein